MKQRTINTAPAIVEADLDFASIAGGATGEDTITVGGAKAGDPVVLGLPTTIEAGLIGNAYVSADDTVTVRLGNVTSGAIDPAEQTFSVAVFLR